MFVCLLLFQDRLCSGWFNGKGTHSRLPQLFIYQLYNIHLSTHHNLDRKLRQKAHIVWLLCCTCIVFVFLLHCNCMKKEINILARSVYLVWAVCPELSCQRQTLSLLTNLSQRFTFYNSMWFTVTFHNCIQIINTWIWKAFSCWSSVKVIQI